jgi:hypothetical protein
MTMRALLMILALAAAPTVEAQTARPAAERSVAEQKGEAEVLAVVNRLWEAMRTNDSTMARSVFDTSAQMVRIVDRDGTRFVQWQRADNFARAIGRAREPWIERMVAPEVRIDANLASVWTWYDFTVGGKVSHCGYDSIELARMLDGWKIIYIADTQQRTGCEQPRVPG